MSKYRRLGFARREAIHRDLACDKKSGPNMVARALHGGPEDSAQFPVREDNENTYGLLGLSKSTDFTRLIQGEIKRVRHLMNTCARRVRLTIILPSP